MFVTKNHLHVVSFLVTLAIIAIRIALSPQLCLDFLYWVLVHSVALQRSRNINLPFFCHHAPFHVPKFIRKVGGKVRLRRLGMSHVPYSTLISHTSLIFRQYIEDSIS